ncbi:MAG TPA: FAD-dependent oxidoreductase [Bosea sp. (in: a-proteobacteria)]|jgi:monoamine oxidase/SAM-dependent methyltransferase|uniref:FAD-dependent oxidoreductase n=1 Tax=Bosea sp. (in: a-proteobacteria) TaxID=1871050 RepID=UPI002E0D1D16|nr:FAD-dependent oxidoreductase [Bosea sp. (in: a-proteobacteria)]
MFEVGIVGGGPGGLMAAWHLRRKLQGLCRVTLFEASERLGGKIVSRRFDSAPALYEAGVAEIYGYGHLGYDPLREMIEGFGFQTIPMDSQALVLDGQLVDGVEGIRRRYGDTSADAILAFRARCVGQMSQQAYYEGAGKHDNGHPWMFLTADEVLDREVADPVARRFFRAMARSDIAAEGHLSNGLNALKNYLMDVDGYIDIYSIQNGNEQLVEGLSASLDAEVFLNHRVLGVGKAAGGRYRLDMMNGKGPEAREFDFVLMCLPHNWLGTIDWGEGLLRRSMTRHLAHFDRPAHYLRVAALFDKPFWEGQVEGAWFMSESLGGCCVYIEGARHDVGRHGVLNWLIAGNDALSYANLGDEALTQIALKSLPASLGDPFPHLIEAKVHRWLASVNAVPGGMPVRDVVTNHLPEPKEHDGLMVVGDYLFDSTLNGVLDSADIASDLLLGKVMRRRYAAGLARSAGEAGGIVVPEPSQRIDRGYFDTYRGAGPYHEVWHRFSDPAYIRDLIELVWRPEPGFRMLVAGSASGELVEALRQLGIDACGVENNRYIHRRTPSRRTGYNLFGTVADLPFDDGSFDIVYESCLAHLGARGIRDALGELHRVARRGVYFGSVTADLTTEVCDMYDLLRGVKKIATWWEWSELFFEEDFDLAIQSQEMLDLVWQRTLAADKGPGRWYEDAESLRYCFFNRVTPDDA